MTGTDVVMVVTALHINPHFLCGALRKLIAQAHHRGTRSGGE